jgi:hypothetical protein
VKTARELTPKGEAGLSSTRLSSAIDAIEMCQLRVRRLRDELAEAERQLEGLERHRAQLEPPTFRNVLACHSSQLFYLGDMLKTARGLGYTYVSFNGRVITVADQRDVGSIKDFQLL